MSLSASTAPAQSANQVSLSLDSPELASTYERVSTRQFDHGKVLIAALDPRPCERVLDIGCGTGRLGAYVAGLVAPGGQVVGIDPLPLRVEIAASKHALFQASVGRAEDLSQFASESFDVVYLNSVFHWIEDKRRTLDEVRRVLKPGGRFGVNSADASRPHQSAALARNAAVAEGLEHSRVASAVGTNYRLDREGLTELLKSAGFEQVNVEPHTFVDTLTGVDDLIAWSESSSFGNFLADLKTEERARLRRRLERELEAHRGPAGIQLERYLVFGTARR